MIRNLVFVGVALVTAAWPLAAAAETELVQVSFDAKGGELADDLRVVKPGGTYGQNVNLYPSDSSSNYMGLPADKISLADNLFTYATSDRWCNYWSLPIEHILAGRKYTYVLEILSYSNGSTSLPWFNIGHTGDDQPAQLSGTYFEVSGVGQYVRTLEGRDATNYTVLERAFVDFNPGDGSTCAMTFRVSLFAGAAAVPTGDYVPPGSGAECPLPVPTREGYEFAGWQDASGNWVTADTVVPSESESSVTLSAVWHRASGVVMPIKVSFDGNGGTVAEKFRYVNTEQPYGRTLNLFPSDSTANFYDIPSDKLSLEDNIFTLDGASGVWVNMFSKNIKRVEIGETYTYVVEVLGVEGNLGTLAVGRTGGYWAGGQQIQLASANLTLGSEPGVYAVSVVGADYEDGFTTFNYLGRDYFYLSEATKATYRVSLFAGTRVTAANYQYVAPGEGLPLPLPVAQCAGKAFDCWVDAAGNRITDDTLVTADGDLTLTAQWLPWTVEVKHSGRPRVGQPLELSTDYGDGSRSGETNAVTYAWYRGNWQGEYEAEPIATQAEYVPTAADYGHFLKGVVQIAGVPQLESTLWFSRLPVVYVNTADGADVVVKTQEKTAQLLIQGNDAFKQQYEGAATIKGRGNSTWGMPKKPYKLKLDKKADLFGFGKNKHWTLIANYIDESSLRNKLAYDLSGKFGLNYQDSTWVELVFNGRYDGLYVLCEHIRVGETRVDIFDWEDAVEDSTDLSAIDAATTDITGGYLWELSTEYDELSQFKLDVTGDGETGEDIPIMFNKPEYAYTNPAMTNWCQQFWHDVYTSWTTRRRESESGANWKTLCDVDSMVSFWLVNEIFGNDDAWYKSRYCYKDVGGKLTFGPVWDFDWGCGSTQVGMDNVQKWRLAKENNSGWPVSFYKQWLNDPWFCLRAWEKYWEMRPYFAALVRDGGEMDAAVAYLQEAGLVDEARWAADRAQSFGTAMRGFAGDAAKFKEWMTQRLDWLDGCFATVDGFIAEIQNPESSLPYVKRADKLMLSLAARYDSTLGEYHVRAQDALTVQLDVHSSTGWVDVMVNGQFLKRVAVTAYTDGQQIVLAPEEWYEKGHRTLIELIGTSRDTGAVNYTSHMVVNPDVARDFYLILR